MSFVSSPARGQPSRSRIIRTSAIVLFAAYQLAAFYESRADKGREGGVLPPAAGYFLWAANWHMFTKSVYNNTAVVFEMDRGDGRWQPLHMERWYPSKFGEGRYRWERPSVAQVPSLQAPFLAAACRHSKAARVRMVREQWRKHLGRPSSYRRDVERQVTRTWDCRWPAPRTKGRFI